MSHRSPFTFPRFQAVFPVLLLSLSAASAPVILHSQAPSAARAAAQQAPATDAAMPHLQFAFEEIVTLGASIHPGATPWGERNIVPITGGTFQGPRLKGKILPGGWDWQLAGKSGCFSLQADYMIQTDDGVIINVLNKGTLCENPGEPRIRLLTTPVFEAPLGPYQWLNGGAWVGTVDGASVDGKPAVRIRLYKAQ